MKMRILTFLAMFFVAVNTFAAEPTPEQYLEYLNNKYGGISNYKALICSGVSATTEEAFILIVNEGKSPEKATEVILNRRVGGKAKIGRGVYLQLKDSIGRVADFVEDAKYGRIGIILALARNNCAAEGILFPVSARNVMNSARSADVVNTHASK